MAFKSSIATSNKAVENIPSHVVKTCFFTPSSAIFKQHAQLSEAERGENFCETHEIGLRDTKYHNIKYSIPMLPDRESCKYTRQFRGKPPVDLELNHEVFQQYAPKKDNRPSLKTENLCSTTKADFTKPSVVQTKKIKIKPERNTSRTMGGAGTWMATSSQTQKQHGPLKNTWPANLWSTPPTLELPTIPVGYNTTQYHRDFNSCRKPKSKPHSGNVDGLLAGMRAASLKSLQRTHTAPATVAFIGSRN